MKQHRFAVFIPLHEFSIDRKALLERAVASIPQGYGVYIVCPPSISQPIAESIISDREINYLHNSGETDIPSQLNLAYSSIDADYIIYLEYDDAMKPNYADTVEKLIEAHPNTAVALPLGLRNIDGNVTAFLNSFLWSPLFLDANDAGRISPQTASIITDMPHIITNFLFSGSAVSKKVSGIKIDRNIKHGFLLEFALRISDMGFEVRVMPKAVYSHSYGIIGSYDFIHRNNPSSKADLDALLGKIGKNTQLHVHQE